MEYAIQVLQKELDRLIEKQGNTQDKVIKHSVAVKIEAVKRAISMITE